MSTAATSTEPVIARPDSDPANGHIRWDATKSLWLSTMIAGGLAALALTPSLGGLALTDAGAHR